jgi:hypothetical protein
MRLDMSREVLKIDMILTTVMLILFILETLEVVNSPVTVMTRVYLKLPFVYCLWTHH